MLMIHLPLNGDLHNQGLANIEVTNSGATVDNNGKIGKCYSFDGTSKYISLTNPFTDASEISCSIWIKPLANTNTNEQIINIGTSSGWNNIRFGILQQSNNQLLFHVSDGTNNIGSRCYSSAINLNEWIHIVCTYKNRELKMYLNGELAKTYSISFDPSFSSISKIGIGAAPNGAEKFTGFINDVKIFSHCLSQKEISELKKMLILHYPLDNNGIGGKNLLVGTNNGIANWQWTMQVGDFTKTEETTLSGIKGCKFIRGSTTHSGWSVIYYGVVDESVFKPSTNYVLSVDIYTTVETSFAASVKQVNAINAFTFNSKTQSVIPNKWNHVVFNLTTVSTLPSSTDEVIYFQNMDSSTGVSYIFKNLKLEEGDKATPWCPNSSDALYTALGYDDGIEYDTSGYGNNGTKVGTLSYSTDSPRYLASTVFDGSQAIRLAKRLYDSVSQLTVTEWFKTNTRNSTSPNLFSLGENAFLRVRLNTDNALWWYIKGQNDAYTAPSSLIDNKWHFFAITFNSGIVKMYLDGVLVKTKDISSAMSEIVFAGSDATFWGLGGYTASAEKYVGHLSDFRVYSSCLSDTEIQKLYTVSASIDSNGNAYSNVFVE